MRVLIGVALATLLCAQQADAAPKKTRSAASHRAHHAAATRKPANPERAGALESEFRCELGSRVYVRSANVAGNSILLNWKGREYRLEAVQSASGADRYEGGAESGLVWIVIPSKAILLDAKLGRPLANECRRG